VREELGIGLVKNEREATSQVWKVKEASSGHASKSKEPRKRTTNSGHFFRGTVAQKKGDCKF
jgi:hypothetical protein